VGASVYILYILAQLLLLRTHAYTSDKLKRLCLLLYYIWCLCNWNLLLLNSSHDENLVLLQLMSCVDADHAAVDHAVVDHYQLHVCTRDTHFYAVVQH
jgi:hypothetical protein